MNDRRKELFSKYEMGGPFIMHLLFEEEVKQPSEDEFKEILEKHLGSIEFFHYDENVVHVSADDHLAIYDNENGHHEMAAQLMVNGVREVDSSMKRELENTRMWDCSGCNDMIERSKFHVMANDFMAGELKPMQRADLDMDFMEALMDLFPTCIGVWFAYCGKLFSREQIINHKLAKIERFVYFAVNVRLFNLKDRSDVLIDTLGMSSIGLPDLQYYFKKMDPNWVSHHAHVTLIKMMKRNAPFPNNCKFDGVVNGKVNPKFKWKTQYQEAVAKPDRVVIDVHMGEYTASK